MKVVLQFIKMTIVGGLVVVLPVWLTLMLIYKAVSSAINILHPFTLMLPETASYPKLSALVLLLVICFVAGLLMRTLLARSLAGWLEKVTVYKIPGYEIIKGIIQQLAGNNEEQPFQPALAEIDTDVMVPAFIVEEHADGKFTVFVSSSPTPMAGAIYILPADRVHQVDISMTKAMTCIAKWGLGSREFAAGMPEK